MMKLLMGDKHHDGFTPTLLEFPNCYLNSDFREWLLKRTDEREVHDFIGFEK